MPWVVEFVPTATANEAEAPVEMLFACANVQPPLVFKKYKPPLKKHYTRGFQNGRGAKLKKILMFSSLWVFKILTFTARDLYRNV